MTAVTLGSDRSALGYRRASARCSISRVTTAATALTPPTSRRQMPTPYVAPLEATIRRVDVCVVTYRNDASRVKPALRSSDRLWVRDNTDDNIGFSAAANELAWHGDQDVILFINPDGDPQPGCFDAIERCVMADGVVAAEGGDGSAREAEPFRATWLSGAILAVRRQAFEAVGGFDESFFLYCEDVDLSWRLASYGRLARCSKAIFLHDGGGHSFSARRWYTISQLRLSRKYLGADTPARLARYGAGRLLRGEVTTGLAILSGTAAFLVGRTH